MVISKGKGARGQKSWQIRRLSWRNGSDKGHRIFCHCLRTFKLRMKFEKCEGKNVRVKG